MDLQYPWIRSELLVVVQELANPLFQWQVWIEGQRPYGDSPDGMYGFDTTMHFILDDNNLYEDTQACLGVILKTQEEVDVMRKLADAVDAVLQAVTKEEGEYRINSRFYITHPLWADVIATAREAVDAFCNVEYGYPVKKQP